jgi:hypothetical protein
MGTAGRSVVIVRDLSFVSGSLMRANRAVPRESKMELQHKANFGCRTLASKHPLAYTSAACD